MKTSNNLHRREFFKLTALTTGGFILGVGAQEKTTAGAVFSPNALIEITSTGNITLTAHMPDVGQGVKTSLPMLIAEELDVPWETVKIKTEVANEKIFGRQTAGGSQSVKSNYDRLRRLGAAAREMLVAAAAEEWAISADQCVAERGKVTSGTKSLSYGELAAKAAQQKAPDPKRVSLKDPQDFKIMGKRIGGVDNEAIVTGQPLFGIDQLLKGLKYASYLRCPSFQGEVKSANLDEIKSLPGVSDAFILKSAPASTGGLYGGVAIIADSTWRAMKAQEALKVTWDTPQVSQHNSETYAQQAKKAVARDNGQGGKKSIEAFYHYPLLAHNTLEPQNCTAVYKNGNYELWSPTQCPRRGTEAITRTLKAKSKQIKIHVVRSGGGFGRRINSDVIVEAAAIAQKAEGTPIKLTWTREQDIQQDYYRNACWHLLQGSVNAAGKITSLNDHCVALGANGRTPGVGGKMNKNMFPFPFVQNSRIKQSVIPTNVPFGWWRAPGSNGFAFAVQCFVDELAHAAKKDPVDFRREILQTKTKAKSHYNAKRMSTVLDAVCKKAEWGKALPAGSAQGVAFYYSHSGYAAVVAEVTVSKDGKLKVDKMTAAVDVGPILNLSGAENQVQGSMLDGLSSAWYQKIEVKDGVVQNSNFHDYPVLRMPEAPQLEVEFVESNNPPTGLGEPALPPAIPAVCNAIFSATGKRVRSLPISDHDLSWG